MRDPREKFYQDYEINKHRDFFDLVHEVCNDLVTRKHLMVFFPSHSERVVRVWKELGIIQTVTVAGLLIYQLKYNTVLDVFDRSKLTPTLILRSYMRLEHYFSRGLKTPAEILKHAWKGNDKVIRDGHVQCVLEEYQEALEERGITVPFLDSPENAKTIEDLATRNLFLSKIQLKDGVLVPRVVYYAIHDWSKKRCTNNLLRAYRELRAMLYTPDGPEIRPIITVLHFGKNDPSGQVYRSLQNQPEFLLYDTESLSLQFPFLSIKNPFPKLPAENLV